MAKYDPDEFFSAERKQTNADKIRKMDDAELAAWLFAIQYHERCDHYNPFPSKITAWLKWLKQEVE